MVARGRLQWLSKSMIFLGCDRQWSGLWTPVGGVSGLHRRPNRLRHHTKQRTGPA
jgi:hypothetical protein